MGTDRQSIRPRQQFSIFALYRVLLIAATLILEGLKTPSSAKWSLFSYFLSWAVVHLLCSLPSKALPYVGEACSGIKEVWAREWSRALPRGFLKCLGFLRNPLVITLPFVMLRLWSRRAAFSITLKLTLGTPVLRLLLQNHPYVLLG